MSEKPLKDEIAEFLLPFRKMVADRQIQLKLKVLPGMDESTRFCLAWRVYKSILYHIVYNAIKFSNNQGKIGIQITYKESDQEISHEDSFDGLEDQNYDSALRFGVLSTIVVDNGVGMDERQLKKLGQSFKKEE
jgi:signal transduction histidine kinase